MATPSVDPGVCMVPRRKAILCLCHDNNMLQVRRMLLERFGYVVFSSNTIEEAQNVIEQHCPDMLLMDNAYPHVDCEQIAKQGKTLCPDMLTVVLSPYYYGGRNGSDEVIDKFITNDEGPHMLISEIEGLFGSRANAESAN
jgi:CheY-like chemotaxis protein